MGPHVHGESTGLENCCRTLRANYYDCVLHSSTASLTDWWHWLRFERMGPGGEATSVVPARRLLI